MNLARELDAGLAGLGLQVDAGRQAVLLAYLDLLAKWNRTYNLTAIHEPERMLTHHILDSLSIAAHVGAGSLLDVGSGAGLPGIPLAILRPDLEVTLLDASQKKCGFMQQAAIELKLPVRVVHGRAESLAAPPAYRHIASRAFADLSEFVRLTAHLLAPGGSWLAMKGLYPHEEVAQLKGARVGRDIPLRIPGLEAERHLILLEPLS